ncbi:MAG: hypothetical protein ABSD74_19275 [Rhizomicrobium sp.]|jgi:hypothetical protein
MKRISYERFEALAAYARAPITRLYAEEVGWFEHANERVLGLLIRDRTDNDFGGVILAHDKKLRYRCAHATAFDPSVHRARIALRREMERAAAESGESYHQGDEQGEAIDFFSPLASTDALNPHFVRLRDLEQYSAARGIIEPMMRWYEDVDGNFVEQFQTAGFDPRIWELYLFAAFHEMGFAIDRTYPAPDFRCFGPFGSFCVEATTVNPSRDASGAIVPEPPLTTPDDMEAYLRHYMPIKFGSALYSKLQKKYWDKTHVGSQPFIIALQDFSAPQSMTRTRSAFESYVFGYAHDWDRDEKGNLRIHPRKIEKHTWGSKEIPSGFFDQPDTENISAVIFSNSGTISKFNRMGVLAGFGSPRLRLIRTGFAVDHDPNASASRAFRKLVNDPGYSEIWSEGMSVWHNPKARYPLEADMLPYAAHHHLLPDGQIESLTPDWHPFGSITLQALVDNDSASGVGK